MVGSRIRNVSRFMPTMPKTHKPALAAIGEFDVGERQASGRETSHRRGYTKKWNKASKALRVEQPLCKACHLAGIVQATECTDHIIPPKGNMKLFWDRNNWQTCCNWHHDVVKQKIEREYYLGVIPKANLRLDSPYALQIAAHLRCL